MADDSQRSRDDLIVVQLAPEFADVPTDGHGIRRRVGEIIFNRACRRDAGDHRNARLPSETPIRRTCLQFACTASGRHATSCMSAVVHEARARGCNCFASEGRIAARRFLEAHGADIGVRETLDVAKAFSDEHKPKMRVAVKDGLSDAGQGLLSTNA
jgi:hypothetical protein